MPRKKTTKKDPPQGPRWVLRPLFSDVELQEGTPPQATESPATPAEPGRADGRKPAETPSRDRTRK